MPSFQQPPSLPLQDPSVAAAGGIAAQVCAVCKARKKKCDKALPRCGFCIRKGLQCGYGHSAQHSQSFTRSRSHDSHHQPLQARHQKGPVAGVSRLPHFDLPLAPLGAVSADVAGGAEATLYLQVQSFIRSAGLFVDDVSVRYFQGIHRYIPIISRTRFHNDLITLGAAPSAGFSTLLLAMCLSSSCPVFMVEQPAQDGSQVVSKPSHVDHDSLYLTATALFAQVQALFPPSISLVQAGLLLAVYEYMSGRSDKAFASIGGCARMAYAARIHVCNVPSSQLPWRPMDGRTSDRAYQLQVQEAANTWWGIIIWERTFFCDVTVAEQPLVSRMSGGDARLPIESGILEQVEFLGGESVPYVPVSYISAVDVGSFGRNAQAAWLLDQVLKVSDISNVDTRMFQLQGLDTTLQTFLAALMQQCEGGQTDRYFCEAIAISIRALFTLHWHILDLFSGLADEQYQALQDWCKSHAALNTTTKIVVDVVEAHEGDHASVTSAYTAPSYPYLIRAALQHIYKKNGWEEDAWLRSAEERLRTSLNRFT
ncbi:hypothetical protein GQ43DRAFT_474482 [Delitschia confertaspora ATCC 74209]|uniref:Zn(2)-C6 fungal-type domain-containing protein n=1 Tax=Delitschia confertaspora ATCC 74209 TaxID=1513339 RepID=A0A9P4JFX8_9PLEO|nr:hypothetical protein GQ43DRAFT_474482 [Delitschia confertaspora ATCC 74209]